MQVYFQDYGARRKDLKVGQGLGFGTFTFLSQASC
jgi:hypothetical protein